MITISLYLTNFFRLVKDCEAIRKLLLGHKSSPEERKWTIMGQSFGGFCAINYLSFYHEGIKEVFLTGGLAPLVDQPDPVYESLAREPPHYHHALMMNLIDCPRSGDQTQCYLLRKISTGYQTSISIFSYYNLLPSERAIVRFAPLLLIWNQIK
jgi:pimeloyl-ACP methyl ester carboxylesterase